MGSSSRPLIYAQPVAPYTKQLSFPMRLDQYSACPFEPRQISAAIMPMGMLKTVNSQTAKTMSNRRFMRSMTFGSRDATPLPAETPFVLIQSERSTGAGVGPLLIIISGQHQMSNRRSSRPDLDLNIVAQPIQAIHQFPFRYVGKIATEQAG